MVKDMFGKEIQPKAPTHFFLVSLLLLIFGILYFIKVVLLLYGFTGQWFDGQFFREYLVDPSLIIIASLAVRSMRKWGLYIFSVIALFFLYENIAQNYAWISLIILILVAYFWTMYKRFS